MMDNQLIKLAAVRLGEARLILASLGLEKYASADRNCLAFLALAGLPPKKLWSAIDPVALGVTPIMNFIAREYGVDYAPNTRETIRKDSIKPLERLGIAIRNPEDPTRPTNSPHTDYSLDPNLAAVLRQFGTDKWDAFAARYVERLPATSRSSRKRRISTPVTLPNGSQLLLSPGAHSELIRAIVESFCHQFLPEGAQVAYVGDTADNTTLQDAELLERLGIDLALSAQKPDVILWYPTREWLVYLEAVVSSGEVDEPRKRQLARLSNLHTPIYVSCFADRKRAAKAFVAIAAQTEVWIAEEPDHLIHFDGQRFLGPYK